MKTRTDKQMHVLLVEDNPTDALLLQEELADVRVPQLTMRHVSRLRDAMREVCETAFDVILLDLNLPDSRGLETFTKLQHVALRKPIIVLSGLDDEEVAIETVHAGAQDYLVKGRVERDLLVRAMRYAVQRKQIEEELRQRTAQLQEDLDMAREFQQAFLPRRYPSFPADAPADGSRIRFAHFYQPSGSVGGDYFDLLRLSDTRAGVFLCDVMGHGVRAALVTAMIRGLVEELKPAAGSPGQFLTELNHALADVLEQTDTTMFASAFYAVVDLETSQLRFARAGHPAPLHLQPSLGRVEAVELDGQHPGPVLGLFNASQYQTEERKLTPGDRLFLYTDGLYEVEGANDDQFGTERLRQAVQQRIGLAPNKLFEELMQAITRYAGGGAFLDDVCMVSVEIVG